MDIDWRKKIFDLVFGPAIVRLSAKSPSRFKGAGNVYIKKWHIHNTDWSKIAYHVDKILMENNIFGQHL